MKENSVIMALLMLVVAVCLTPLAIDLYGVGNKYFSVFPFLCLLSAILHTQQALRKE